MDVLQPVLVELAKNSPYAVIIIVLLWFFSKQNKSNLEQVNKMFETSLSEIRDSHLAALKEMNKNTDLLRKSLGVRN